MCLSCAYIDMYEAITYFRDGIDGNCEKCCCMKRQAIILRIKADKIRKTITKTEYDSSIEDCKNQLYKWLETAEENTCEGEYLEIADCCKSINLTLSKLEGDSTWVHNVCVN